MNLTKDEIAAIRLRLTAIEYRIDTLETGTGLAIPDGGKLWEDFIDVMVADRRRRRITQYDLARRIGIGQTAVGRFEGKAATRNTLPIAFLYAHGLDGRILYLPPDTRHTEPTPPPAP